MKTKSLLLSAILTVATIQFAQAEKILHIRNQSPLAVEFSIPDHEIASREELEHTPSQKIILAPAHRAQDSIAIRIAEDIQHFWIRVIPQPLCHEGRTPEPVKVSCFCIDEQNPIYDFYATTNTRFNNWLSAFCCYGFIDIRKAREQFNFLLYVKTPESEEQDPATICFPVGSHRQGANLKSAFDEVKDFAQMVRISHQLKNLH